MIYAGKNFANDNLEMDKLSEYDLWLAHYTGATEDDPLESPSSYTGKYTMWQYTSSGTCEGIDHRVDRNISYKVY
jgi:GH25 family lysozyme M1 (1,4-beta-N-acetylmuramidase)